MKKFLLVTSCIAAASLAACVSQDQADAKMTKGCKAVVNALIAPKTLNEIKSTTVGDEVSASGVFRKVTITAAEQDGWITRDQTYECAFAEQWGLMKSSHIALLERTVYNGQTIGRQDGKIVGAINDFMKLNETAGAAMGQ